MKIIVFVFFSSSLPSIWKTSVGYLIFIGVIILGDIVSILFALSTTSFTLGSGWLFKSFMEDIMNELPHLYVSNESHGDVEWLEMHVHFCNIVKLYTNVKELRVLSSIFYAQILTNIYFWYLDWLRSSIAFLNFNCLLSSYGVFPLCALYY